MKVVYRDDPSDDAGLTYLKKYQGLKGNPKLTPIQAYNLEANAQLIALENARAPQQKKVKEEENDAELFGF